jgi:uncharacterized membrane protein
MESDKDKDKVIRLEEAYRKLWAEQEDLKARIKENYAEFKVLRDQLGVDKIEIQQTVSSTSSIQTETESFPTPQPLVQSQQTPANLPQKKKTSWEQFIGEQLLSKIGIVIVLIGVGIGAKYAIDHDLIGQGGRVLSGFVVALILGVFAFVFRTKYQSFSAVLASGAIGVAYFITYAAYSFYQLIPSSMAFGGLLVLVLIAVFLAMYYNMSIIAHLGLLGAYILPPLVSDGSKHISYYLLYMLIINLGMLLISIVRKWPTIQYPVIVWTAFIFLFWFNTDFSFELDSMIAASYLIAFFSLFVFAIVGRNLWKKDPLINHQVIQLILVGICYFGAVGYVNDHSPSWQTILFNLIGIAVYLVIRAIFAKEERLDFKRVFGALTIFGLANCLTVFCGDYSYIYVLISGALILFWLSEEIQGKLEEVIGVILFSLASLLIIIEAGINLFKTTKQDCFADELVLSIGLIVLAIGLTFVLLRRFQPEYHSKLIWKTAGVFGFILLVFCGYYAISVHLNFETDQTMKAINGTLSSRKPLESSPIYGRFNTLKDVIMVWKHAWISISVLVTLSVRKWVLGRTDSLSGTAIILGVVFLGLSLLGLSFSEMEIPRLLKDSEIWSSYKWAHYCLLACVLGTTLIQSTQSKQEDWVKALLLLLVLWVLSLELVQWSLVSGFGTGYKILLSVLWVAFAIAMIIIGIKRRQPIMRITAMVILGITILKMFFYDLSTLSTIYKTVVVIAIGGLLLVGAYFYQVMSKQEEK